MRPINNDKLWQDIDDFLNVRLTIAGVELLARKTKLTRTINLSNSSAAHARGVLNSFLRKSGPEDAAQFLIEHLPLHTHELFQIFSNANISPCRGTIDKTITNTRAAIIHIFSALYTPSQLRYFIQQNVLEGQKIVTDIRSPDHCSAADFYQQAAEELLRRNRVNARLFSLVHADRAGQRALIQKVGENIGIASAEYLPGKGNNNTIAPDYPDDVTDHNMSPFAGANAESTINELVAECADPVEVDRVLRDRPTLDGIYRLKDPIGSGRHSVVWTARDNSGDGKRIVTIKVAHAHQDRKDYAIRRMWNGARICWALRGVNGVCTISTTLKFQMPGLVYYVMPYYPFGDLGYAIKHRRISPDSAMEIVLQIMSALSEAHNRLIFHRDIKPQNILVGNFFGAALTDWDNGSSESNIPATGPNDSVGTPGYESPESTNNKIRRDDHLGLARADIYSIARTLIFCILKDQDMKAETEQLEESLRQVAPRQVVSVLLIAGATDAARRYQSMPAFYDALRDAITDAKDHSGLHSYESMMQVAHHPIHEATDVIQENNTQIQKSIHLLLGFTALTIIAQVAILWATVWSALAKH